MACEEKNTEAIIIETEEERQYIVEQIRYLRQEYVSIQSSFLTLISVSAGAYGLIIYYAISLEDACKPNDVNLLFLILPFLFLLSFYNIIKYTIRMLGIGSYLRVLERMLNQSTNKPLFLWSSYLINANLFGLTGGFGQVPCYVAICVFVGHMFFVNLRKGSLPEWAYWTLIISLGVQLFLLLIMLLQCITESNCIEFLCDKAHTSGYDSVTNVSTYYHSKHFNFSNLHNSFMDWILNHLKGKETRIDGSSKEKSPACDSFSPDQKSPSSHLSSEHSPS